VKTSLDHLPLRKRDQLVALTAKLQQLMHLEMLILFGSHARGDWVEDEENDYLSDYDLLVIVDSFRLATNTSRHQIHEEVRRCTGETPVSLITHDIRHVNTELRLGQYFFTDVAKEGILLYDSKRFGLSKPGAIPGAKRVEIALEQFERCFVAATEFWRGTDFFAHKRLESHAAFLLFQAAETYLQCMLLVCTNYKPKTHDLADLCKATAEFHPLLIDALPRRTPADARHFDLLRGGYLDARYSSFYRVNATELAAMRAMVLDLGNRVYRACTEILSKMATHGQPLKFPTLPVEFRALPDVAAGPARTAVTLTRPKPEETRGFQEPHEDARLKERAHLTVGVLRQLGFLLTKDQEERVLACRDEVLLASFWSRAFKVTSIDELGL
jgi:predicted nucleotidyltransferase/HEPN domain-containing protein